MFYTKKFFKLYNENGNPISDKTYSMVSDLTNGFARVKYNDKYGFIDENGNEICETKYDDTYNFHDGFAAVKINDKWGFIDKYGKEICDIIYDTVFDFCEGFAPVCINHKWGFIDESGKEICDIIYDTVFDFCEGFAAVEINDKWAFIDKSGKKICDFIYSSACNFINGLAKVSVDIIDDDDLYTYINEKGNEICKRYNDIGNFVNGFAIIEGQTENGYKFGFINTEGKEILTPGLKYDEVKPFSGGMAVVGTAFSKRAFQYKYGYIDETGNEVVKCQFVRADNFKVSTARVLTLSGKFVHINKKGIII